MSPALGDRLSARVAGRSSQLVLGLDPDPSALWPGTAAAAATGDPAAVAAAAVLGHCRALIDATGDACVAVKPQLARFEALGAPGREALGAVIEHARNAGLLVIADGKRGDIDVTAEAYAASLFGGLETPFGHAAGLGADLVTVNPLMGIDAVEPFVRAGRERGAGVLLLVRTSNPGAAGVQDLELAAGGPFWERLAALVAELGVSGESGLADVGAVIGATAPGTLARARELMPAAPFLLPGIGAQGGRVEDLGAAFAPGPAGGLVSASRSIAGAYLAGGGAPADAARAEAGRLRELAWELSKGAVNAG